MIEPRNWRKCTLFDVNFRPLNMSPERLEQKFRELAAELYSAEALEARHRRFKEKLRPLSRVRLNGESDATKYEELVGRNRVVEKVKQK